MNEHLSPVQTPPPDDIPTSTTRFSAPPSPATVLDPDFLASGRAILKNRYQLFEQLKDDVDIVYAIDRKSIQPKNRRVMVRQFTCEEEWMRYKSTLSRLRSPYVTSILDEWASEEYENVFYVVQDRGSVRLDEFIAKLKHDASFNAEKHELVLAELAKCWLFLHSCRYLVIYQVFDSYVLTNTSKQTL